MDSVATFTDTTRMVHVCGTYDASTNDRRIYRNGVLVAQGTATSDYLGTTALWIARGGLEPANGIVDDVAVYNRVLKPSEVRLLSSMPYAPLVLKRRAIWAGVGGNAYSETLDAGTYSLSGVSESHQIGVNEQAGSISVAGDAISPSLAVNMPIGNYAMSGQASILSAGYITTAVPGSFNISGGPVEPSISSPMSSGQYATAGNDISPGHGVHIHPGSLSVSGASIQHAISPILSSSQYQITGQSSGLLSAYLATAEPGSISVNGQSLSFGTGLALGSSAYSISGSPSSLLVAYLESVAAGSYLVSGLNAVIGGEPQSLACDTGVYLLVGDDVALALSMPLSMGTLSVSGATASYGIEISQGASAYVINGADIQLILQALVSASYGTYGITGIAATLTDIGIEVLIVEPGAYATAGNPASIVGAYRLIAESGAYALTGSGMTRNISIPSSSGSYQLTGTVASLPASYLAIASPGVYSLAGLQVHNGIKMVQVPGSYFISADDITLAAAYLHHLQSGSYNVLGVDSSIVRSLHLLSESGQYAVSGSNASQLASYTSVLDVGNYNLSGIDAILYFSLTTVPGIIRINGIVAKASAFNVQARSPIVSPGAISAILGNIRAE